MGNIWFGSEAEDLQEKTKEITEERDAAELDARICKYLSTKRCPIIINLIVGTLIHKTNTKLIDLYKDTFNTEKYKEYTKIYKEHTQTYKQSFNTKTYGNKVQDIRDHNGDVAKFEEYVAGLSEDFYNGSKYYKRHAFAGTDDDYWRGIGKLLKKDPSLEKFLYQLEDMIKNPEHLVIGEIIVTMFQKGKANYVWCNVNCVDDVDSVGAFINKLHQVSMGKGPCYDGRYASRYADNTIEATDEKVADFIADIKKSDYANKEWPNRIETGMLDTSSSNFERSVSTGDLTDMPKSAGPGVQGGGESDMTTAILIAAIILWIVWQISERPVCVFGMLVVLIVFYNAGYLDYNKRQ